MQDSASEELFTLIKQYEAEQRRLFERYPPDVPNDVCRHAIVSGILVENSPGFAVGELTPLMTLPLETVYVWTCRANQNSSILSEVHPSIKAKGFWKNAGQVLTLAHALAYACEQIMPEHDYYWIYYFDPKRPIDDCEFLDDRPEFHGAFVGYVEQATFFQRSAPLVDLMLTDDRFYMAASLLVQSMLSHYCCLACEFQRGGYPMHPSHEPRYWEQAAALPRMQSAIVQACRCAESLLGQPGKRGKAEQRWREALAAEPTEPFFKSGTSLLDYYYRLFPVRNISAHSNRIDFATTRKETIEAQCFAWIVLQSYIERHARTGEQACEAIGLNVDLMQRVTPDISTSRTREEPLP